MPAMNPHPPIVLLAFAVCVSAIASPVRVWQTNLVIPTYVAAPPSLVPRFYDGRTYQGAKATFYPYPVQDVLTDERTNQTYRALFLENDYLQLSVLPELGGRIWSATDKANGYDFFYRQHVVKPALIGMLGAWISGGVEWNVPHHHRASSFMPVDYTTTTNADGSATIWVGEIELRHRMKWLVGMTLYPDRSYLELTCKVFNRTPFAHPMLFWINPAVHANEHYQVLFPPGTEWATQHGKPEFASWPIARQTYGGTDYTRGVDISWWKNHPNPVSFFAWNYRDDWFGGYDHGRQAGVIHWADHHVAPGKKFFEWGNGPEGEMWTRILTDEDGPYLELMAGAWSDNQPDYSWIQPGETREWKHWWYPIRNLGGVKAATRDAAVNLEVTNRTAKIAVNATRLFTNAIVELRWGDNVLRRWDSNLSPQQPFADEESLEGFYESEITNLAVTVRLAETGNSRVLVSFDPPRRTGTPMPKPVERPRPPKDYASLDELYFTGQRIEQLYSPSFEAWPYYEEMLRRDPGDYRANTALGILLCKQWRWDEAAKHLSNAVARATANYIRPKDGEAFYWLGIALRGSAAWRSPETIATWRDRLAEAADCFRKAGWSVGWQAPGFFQLAQIESLRGDHVAALAAIDESLLRNGANPQALSLRSAILRRLEKYEDARRAAAKALEIDPLDGWSRVERFLASQARPLWPPAGAADFGAFQSEIADLPIAEVLEIVADYVNGGFPDDALNVLRATTCEPEKGWRPAEPLVYYWARQLSRSFDYPPLVDTHRCVFPFQHELIPVLAAFGRSREKPDARASYLLGCLLYDHQPENAIKAWETSREYDDKVALTHRNLALAYAQHEKDIAKAIASLERAVELDPTEPRFFYELDVQYEAGGTPVAKRLEMLTRHHDTVAKRDDALTREIVLLTVAGQPERALELLRGRHFRNWEGSSQIHNVYVDACLARGQQLLAANQPGDALREFEAALEYPENLEVGRARRSPRTAQIQFFIGAAHEALRDAARAKAAFEQAVAGRRESGSETAFYRGLALRKLGREDEAKTIFENLVKTGEEQLTRGDTPDYFAKFGERQSERVRQAGAHYLIALGRLGLGETAGADAAFKQVLELHPAHLGASQR